MRLAAAILALLAATCGAFAADPRAAMLLDELPSADGLLAEYQVFDNADDSARLNHATLGNGATAHSRRLWFDGADDYARTASNETLNVVSQFTVMAWIYPTNYAGKFTSGNAQAIASRYDAAGGSRSWEIAVSLSASGLPTPGNVCVQLGNPASGAYSGRAYINPGTTYSGNLFGGVTLDNNWYHIAFTFDSGSVLIWVNGVSYEPNTASTIPTTLYTSALPLTIGNIHDNSHGFFGGIAPVTIYNRVAVDEIQRNYIGGPPQ